MAENYSDNKILIVDDSDMNRAILSEMIGDKYEIIEAENGAEGIAMLQKYGVDISLVLLDIVMPVMNGYEVLEIMNSKHWIDDIPVIMISEESSPSNIERAYDKGVADFIARPFDRTVVLRRIVNTLMLYEKQKKLVELAVSQIYEKEKSSNLMIGILSHIVEFRNGESGLHVIHVQNLTEIMLRTLVKITNKYDLSSHDISIISNASALHDIGKITIPDEILNKPGRLTDEEFKIMKTHSLAGAEMLGELTSYMEDPLVKTAYEICRWHHERFDGRGYPDGLKGDEIPISAQIVALADVYDALTSDRVYKKAFTHERSIEMILNGECGTFNPLLMQCLELCSEQIRKISDGTVSYTLNDEIDDIVGECFRYSELASEKRTFNLLKHEKMINSFFLSVSDEFLFEYTIEPPVLTLSDAAARIIGTENIVVDPGNNPALKSVIAKDIDVLISEKLKAASVEEPEFELGFDMVWSGENAHVKLNGRTTWSVDDTPVLTGVIGKLTKC